MTEPTLEVTSELEDTPANSSKEPKQTRYRNIPKKWQLAMAVMTACSIFLAINQIFNLGFFIGYVMLDSRYMYLITGIMLCMVFVTFPAISVVSIIYLGTTAQS